MSDLKITGHSPNPPRKSNLKPNQEKSVPPKILFEGGEGPEPEKPKDDKIIANGKIIA